jgi:hypothetical protein
LFNADSFAFKHINSTFGESYSTNPEDYTVDFIGCGPEMYSPSGTTGYIGAGESNCKLTTLY